MSRNKEAGRRAVRFLKEIGEIINQIDPRVRPQKRQKRNKGLVEIPVLPSTKPESIDPKYNLDRVVQEKEQALIATLVEEESSNWLLFSVLFAYLREVEDIDQPFSKAAGRESLKKLMRLLFRHIWLNAEKQELSVKEYFVELMVFLALESDFNLLLKKDPNFITRSGGKFDFWSAGERNLTVLRNAVLYWLSKQRI